jgi:hypothetical protein
MEFSGFGRSTDLVGDWMAILANGLLAHLYKRLLHKFYANDLWIDLCLAAKKEAVDYIVANMQDARVLADRFQLLEFALARAPGEGLLCEFGVEKGASLRWLASLCPARTVHGFDSFEGLPSDWRGTKEGRGKFGRSGRLPKTPSNAKLHVGWFETTLPSFAKTTTEPISFAHIDCDIYESTKSVFDVLGERMTAGTVIVFDEYFNYPGWRLHEFKAFHEYVDRVGVNYRYIGVSAERGHVAVQLGGR